MKQNPLLDSMETVTQRGFIKWCGCLFILMLRRQSQNNPTNWRADMKISAPLSKSPRHKKIRKAIVILLVLFLFSISTFCIDKSLLEHDKTPFFSIRYTVMNDGGSAAYFGLGYQLIKWKQLESNEIGGYQFGVEAHYLIGINPFPLEPSVSLRHVHS